MSKKDESFDMIDDSPKGFGGKTISIIALLLILVGSFAFANVGKDDTQDVVAETTNNSVEQSSDNNNSESSDSETKQGNEVVDQSSENADKGSTKDEASSVTPPDKVVVLFGFDKAVLDSTNVAKIDELWEQIKDLNVSIKVEGHTDSVGTEEYNNTLSIKRAQHVLNLLKQRGLDETKVNVQGFGETILAVEEVSEQGNAQNRRVEIIVQGEN